MARAFPPAFCQQFFDENGKPLAAGKLYTYIAGSSTPVLTYKEIIGDSPANQNTNPIILDSAGYAKFVLEDDKAYKLVLKDKNDALKGTWDNVTQFFGIYISGEFPVHVEEKGSIPGHSFEVSLLPNGIGRNLLKNYHNLVPDSRYLQFKDFGGNVVVTLSDALQSWLSTEGYTP